MELVFATQNENKVNEVRQQLPEVIKLYSLKDMAYKDELEEDFDTLEENSLQKARFVFEKFNKPCFAEDTGLEIDALNGEPGVRSARYAGEGKDSNDNMDKVLKSLEGVHNRKAQFKTVITYKDGHVEKQFTGVLTGIIGFEKKGNGGFGYDPIFMINEHTSLAEISKEEKVNISHRGKAFAKLLVYLKESY